MGSQPRVNFGTLCYDGSSTHRLIELALLAFILYYFYSSLQLYNFTILGYWQQDMGMGIAWIWILLAWI